MMIYPPRISVIGGHRQGRWSVSREKVYPAIDFSTHQGKKQFHTPVINLTLYILVLPHINMTACQTPRKAFQNLPRACRRFSATANAAAVSPYRNTLKSGSPRNNADSTKRGQSTAAATHSTSPQRAVPSPAFNRQDAQIRTPYTQPDPEMDHSFVGMKGGEIFHEMMLRHNVKHVFGYPGGAILPVFDAIYNSPHFDFILPRHEQGAGHMAEGYARACGKPGVVLVTSGPGATNVVTPMQDALMDGTPMVVFCGQVPTSSIGSDAFQEADIVGISRACTKWNVMVKNIAELPRRINEAFEIAMSGRPGPVLVDLPKDVTGGTLTRPIPITSTLPTHPSAATLAAREYSRKNLENVIARSAKLINGAKKPVIYAGQGILASPDGPRFLKELSEKAQIPVTTTLQGLGAYDELDPKSLHMLGMHGSAFANMAIQEADVLIALGARFDDRITGHIPRFAPQAKLAAQEGCGGIIHFEIMPKNINKVIQATEAVEGDVVSNLQTLLPLIEKKSESDRSEWFSQISAWKERFPWAYEKEADANSAIKPQTVVQTLSELTAHRKEDTIICTGVGQHQMWAAQHFRWRTPRSMITSGGLGTMGYGLPAAIGAKVAQPDKLVVDIDGDASFSMTLTELSTAAEFNIGVKVLILNNEEQGMVTQWQSLFFQDRFAHTHQRNADFVKLSEAMFVPAKRCVKLSDLKESLEWLIDGSGNGPALLEVVVDQKVPVLPMVPA